MDIHEIKDFKPARTGFAKNAQTKLFVHSSY